jgi:hypothetical protein
VCRGSSVCLRSSSVLVGVEPLLSKRLVEPQEPQATALAVPSGPLAGGGGAADSNRGSVLAVAFANGSVDLHFLEGALAATDDGDTTIEQAVLEEKLCRA